VTGGIRLTGSDGSSGKNNHLAELLLAIQDDYRVRKPNLRYRGLKGGAEETERHEPTP